MTLPLSCPDRSLENMAGRPRLDSLSSVEEDDYDTLTDIDSDKNVIRTKVPGLGQGARQGSGGCRADGAQVWILAHGASLKPQVGSL